MNEKVTWLLPIKDGMPYLPETLASIEAQTYRNWEVLAWDNGSTDGTVAELRKWIPSRLAGRIIDDNPLSLAGSLAKLVETAETELCARIDADDINHPERLEQQVAFLLAHPEVGLVGSEIEFIDEQGRACPGAWRQPIIDAEIRWGLRWNCPFNHPTVMFRRSIILAAGNYADCVPEDLDLWIRVGLITEAANLPRVLLKYRRRQNSFTAMTTGWKSAAHLFEAAAARNSDKLFPGLLGRTALEFRDKMGEESSREASLSDLIVLYKIATAAAIAVGKPASYFRSTHLYASQQRHLLSRWLRQQAWGHACLTARQRVRSCFSARQAETTSQYGDQSDENSARL